MKSLLPNLLTLSNLACGLLAVIAIFSSDYRLAAWLVGVALVLDFLDGFTARLLKVHSEIGKQLDSLADLVTFGVAPGFLLYRLFKMSYLSGEPVPGFLPFIALLIPVFSALRLAKFNVDTRQKDYFIGLPTPASAILIFSLGLWGFYTDNETTRGIILHPFLLTLLTIATSALLVAELPLMSLKLRNLNWRENRGVFILLFLIGLALFFLRFRALAIIIPLYLLLSLIYKPTRK